MQGHTKVSVRIAIDVFLEEDKSVMNVIGFEKQK